ncbi:MAG: hypothetical protein P1V20_21195 [Verrucomicrobiales bacterium]|nr:hypothetical protein [Verrucomicrobiales bacterium]
MSDRRSIWIVWLPSLAGVISLVLIWKTNLGEFSGIPFLISLALPVYLLAITIIRLLQKRYDEVRNSFLMAVLLGGGFISVLTASLDEKLFGSGSDGFVEDLSLPEGVQLLDPAAPASIEKAGQIDAFQTLIKNSLSQPAAGPGFFTAEVANFQFLAEKDPERLTRYLAANPAWRVFEERGAVYANRRWKIRGRWHFVTHGFYSQEDIDSAPEPFQTRFTIGLEGTPWSGGIGGETRLQPGQTIEVKTSRYRGLHESHILVDAAPMIIECFERSKGEQRRITRASFSLVESELAELAKIPDADALFELLPPGSIREGDPQFNLSGSRGIYSSEIWINPGEPGTVYLKAFEITTGKALSPKRLREKSNEKVGWSDDPLQKFLSQTQFTIYEGGRGQFYGARFEVWFAPDSGNPERKLLEQNYRIAGSKRA